MRLSRMTDRSAGGDLARIMYKFVKQHPFDQYGQPPAYHWHQTAVSLQCTPCFLSKGLRGLDTVECPRLVGLGADTCQHVLCRTM